MRITHKMTHNGDVNRARLCPTLPSLVASRSSTGKVYLANLGEEEGSVEPRAILSGLEGEGFGLSWNRANNHIASASHDGAVCEWDVESNNNN